MYDVCIISLSSPYYSHIINFVNIHMFHDEDNIVALDAVCICIICIYHVHTIYVCNVILYVLYMYIHMLWRFYMILNHIN